MNNETIALDRKILFFIRRFSSRKAPDSAFSELALEIFVYQYRFNPLYRRFCDAAGCVPQTAVSWKDIPAIPVTGFRDLVLTSFPADKAVKAFRTSGTTGGPRGAHRFDTLKLYEAALLPPFRQHVMRRLKRARFFHLVSSPKETPDSSLSHMLGVVNRFFSKPAGKFYIRGGKPCFAELERDLAACRTPAVFTATAFSLKAFLDYLALGKRRLKLPTGSRLMETGGFKGRVAAVSKDRLYSLCWEWMGVARANIVGEYGMTELSSQYYGGRVMKAPAWLRTVVVDPVSGREAKAGKPGVLRHYDLANRGSVIAVQTEDLGVRRAGGLELLGRAPSADLRGCSLAYEQFVQTGGER